MHPQKEASSQGQAQHLVATSKFWASLPAACLFLSSGPGCRSFSRCLFPPPTEINKNVEKVELCLDLVSQSQSANGTINCWGYGFSSCVQALCCYLLCQRFVE